MSKQRWWVGEVCCRAKKTIVVHADSRKEAQRKLDNDEGEGVDVNYYSVGRPRIIREDKAHEDEKGSPQ